ncbi:hypothetical protein C8R45DRAFT_929209 [Mycena sanguinolenta]|nr:hypothetical protein C8R45DRAFT_929209 [Mycena sanguinolenta]
MSAAPPQRRTRVYVACQNCRKRKIKCVSDDLQQKPCQRCTHKGLQCEYLLVGEQNISASSNTSNTSHSDFPQLSPAPGSSSYATPQTDRSTHSRHPQSIPLGSRAPGASSSNYIPNFNPQIPNQRLAPEQMYLGSNFHYPPAVAAHNSYAPPPMTPYATSPPVSQQALAVSQTPSVTDKWAAEMSNREMGGKRGILAWAGSSRAAVPRFDNSAEGNWRSWEDRKKSKASTSS